MAGFPKTEAGLVAAGYKFEKQGKCSSPVCGAEIEWWITPKSKRIPLDAGTLEPHFGTCLDVGAFR